MAKFYKERPVFISVYVEKTKRRRVSSNNQHHHHHHHHHRRRINQEIIHDQYKNGGYNRRAELLRYSQSLRDSSTASTLLLPKPIHPHNNNQQQHTSNAVAVRRNRNYARTPDCLGNWRILIPNFPRSFTIPKGKKEKKKKKQSGPTTNKMKALINSFEIPKKLSITKLLSTLRKRR